MSGRRRYPGLVLAALLLLLTTGFRPPGLVVDEGTVTVATARDVQAIVAPDTPELDARAAMLVDNASGQVLFARREHERLPPASTTKLMTALLAVETGRYFDRVTVEPADLVGGSRMGLVAGETLSVRELLDGLLVASGNDAANALARHFGARLRGPGGPVARFVAGMNARADSLGLRNTAFRNPEGFDMSGHYSSAADLATLAQAALRQPVIAQIVGTPAVTITGRQRTYTLRTTNRLLAAYPGTLGVKTGTTDAAGECLIALVERDGRRLLAVVLGSDDRYADTTALLDWGFTRHHWLEPPAGLAEAAARAGFSASLAPGPPVAVPATQLQFVAYELRLPPPGQPAEATLAILLFDRPVATRTVVLYPLGRTRRPLPG